VMQKTSAKVKGRHYTVFLSRCRQEVRKAKTTVRKRWKRAVTEAQGKGGDIGEAPLPRGNKKKKKKQERRTKTQRLLLGAHLGEK